MNTRNHDHKLYFNSEKREDLPYDPMNLIKLDLVKEHTINEYNKEIRKIKRKIANEKQNGDKEYETQLRDIQNTIKENSNILTEEMQNNLLNEKNINQIGK